MKTIELPPSSTTSTPNGKVDRGALPAPARQRTGSDEGFVAPRDALERQLANLWEKIFGHDRIGVRDNFFELGGHSLLAVRLFAQVEKLTGKRLPLVTLFQAPTIEQLAGVLKHEGWEPPWSCLVPIKADGSRPPFYCVHGVGGNILEYLDLAKYMDPDQPFYGIQAIGLDGNIPRENLTVEYMAEHYIGQMRALQPTGPYHLGGSSFGGLVAYEMAQQLTAAGETVGLLALFDTIGPAYPRYLPSTTLWQRRLDRVRHRVGLHWENFLTSRGQERLVYVRVKAGKWGYGLVTGSWRYLKRGWKNLRLALDHFFLPSAIRQVRKAGHWAAEDYQPQPYPGRATLFRAMTQPRGIVEDRTMGWGALVRGGLDIYDTPGHHGAIVRDPRARVLAQQLQEALEKVRKQ